MFAFKLRDQLFAWYRYISQHTIHPDLDPLIADSWRRCSPRLDPRKNISVKKLSPEHLLAAQATHFDIISIARPVMEDIHQFVENSNTVVLLVNSTGYILDCLGDQPMMEIAREHQLEIGALVSEEGLGTNAFALALRERVPIRVVGPAHFLRQFHGLADAASPIFDPSGHPLGALGVLTEVDNYHDHTLGLVVAGARAIEGQRQIDLLLQEQIEQLAELNAILASISEGILVWNAQGILLHANKPSADILGVSAASMLGRHIRDNIVLPDYLLEALNEKRTLNDVDASLIVAGRPVNCLVSIRYAGNPNDSQWTVLTLREPEKVRQLIQHQIGPQVTVRIDDFVGESPAIRRMRRMAHSAAPARASVLIRGETGVGKDYLARALHNASTRRQGPFVIFSCAAVPNELVMGELVGFEQGVDQADSGGRPSKFELAHRGTLFFQDIELLPLETQAQLLNVLELGVVQRLGGTHPHEVDVRVIASTTANLESLVAEGNFRADLFYRLSPFEIVVPPLRERQVDLPSLVERILERLARHHNRRLKLGEGVLNLLQRYHWPGNIRELEAVLERAAIQAGASEVIAEMHLPRFVRHPANAPTQKERLTQLPSLEAIEREALIQAARVCNGNVSQMARVLGIGRTTVWRKLKTLNISPDHFRKRPATS